MEKQFKTYKQYYIYNKTLGKRNKIKWLKELLKVNKNNKQDFENWYYKEAMTEKQYQLYQNNDLKKLKELLKKQIIKEETKLKEAEQEKAAEIEKIKELQDIKSLTIEIEWSNGRRSMGAYQTRAIATAFYKNGTSDRVETSFTGGCGYDKPSTSTAEACDKLAKIILLKHYKKIQKDPEKHYHFYAAENGYYQHGVGISSYITFFKNCGYKVKEIYHHNQNITIFITK